ncbi:uroporphyrinogen-III synthase [Ureibacillus thermophilus]|uniref:Uroporphyrinogen-III synthase n=1 Tax=Ureibacillus thermophilus TaxID=367743 RepID=A0A4P6UV36_9BACL|nr:uroporphyrinogen-III synthase [Ureibacillus thermophilus]QBK26405.1 uroporphyrinogen-III synthase [Ureibacillus thermophilus]
MRKPLEGKTILLTGTKKTQSIVERIEELGGEAVLCPLIQTKEADNSDDEERLAACQNYDWLIFTSQNGVEFFWKKIKRIQFNSTQISCKIAAVGEKTAELLKRYGFNVHFMPSVYSADTFIKEFPSVSGSSPKCLFIRGQLAKDTLKKGLPFPIDEWTVYQTIENKESVKQLIETIESSKQPIIIFASPSAVDCFHKYVAPKVGWERAKIACIGHITKGAVEKYGAHVTYFPATYTMQSVIDAIAKGEEM